jgi:hypothetical protein
LEQVPEARIDSTKRRLHQNLIDFLNVKYVISPYPIPEPAMAKVGEAQHIVGNRQVPLGIFENKNVLPRAHLAGSYKKFDDPKAALGYLASGDFDPRKQVILYEKPEHTPSPDSTASAELITHDLQEVKVQTTSAQPQILVLADTYVPAGWRVTVDGQNAKILQANHAFRAVSLPAGAHEVIFTYSSRGFQIGLWLTILSTAVVAGCIVLGMRRLSNIA